MPIIQLDPLWLLAPALAVGAVIGYRRGWQKEAITATGLALAVGLLWNGPDLLLALANAILGRLARVIVVIAGSDPRGAPPQIALTATLQPVVTIGLLAVLVVLAYRIGGRLGQPVESPLARWFGVVIGGLNFFLVMSRVLGSLTPARPGVAGLTLRLPAFPGATIVVPPPPEGALLVSWPLAAVIFLVVSMLVFALVRMARA